MYNPATQVQVSTDANLGSYFQEKNRCRGFPYRISFQKKFFWSEVAAFEREGMVAEEAMEEVMHKAAKVAVDKMHAIAAR
jgi:hypothetical protein